MINAKIAKGESVNLKLGTDSPLPENLNYSARPEGTPISFVSTKALRLSYLQTFFCNY